MVASYSSSRLTMFPNSRGKEPVNWLYPRELWIKYYIVGSGNGMVTCVVGVEFGMVWWLMREENWNTWVGRMVLYWHLCAHSAPLSGVSAHKTRHFTRTHHQDDGILKYMLILVLILLCIKPKEISWEFGCDLQVQSSACLSVPPSCRKLDKIKWHFKFETWQKYIYRYKIDKNTSTVTRGV